LLATKEIVGSPEAAVVAALLGGYEPLMRIEMKHLKMEQSVVGEPLRLVYMGGCEWLKRFRKICVTRV
jgi:hypothetical protein